MSITVNIFLALFAFAWATLPVIALACGISAVSAWRGRDYFCAAFNAAVMAGIILLSYAESSVAVDVITWLMA